MPSLPHSFRTAAAALARIAVTLSPSSSDLWSNLGLARASLHDREGAKRAYRAATSLQPTSVEALVGLAAALDHPTEAEAVLRDAIAAAPHHAGARYNLGNLLHTSALGEFGEFSPRSAEAVQCFREAARLAPRHVYAHYNAALAAQQAHASRPCISFISRRCISDVSRGAYRRACGGEFISAVSRAYLDYNLQAHIDVPAEAEAAYRRALAIEPNNAQERRDIRRDTRRDTRRDVHAHSRYLGQTPANISADIWRRSSRDW